jgi:hypothetical protein
MTMSMPGAQRPTAITPAITRKTGLVRMQAGASFQLMIRPHGPDQPAVPVYATARAKADAGKVKAVHVCLHPACSGKSWPGFSAMATQHPERNVMAKTGEVHVYGLWSEDPVDPKDKSRGVVGLIAPPEPHAEEE